MKSVGENDIYTVVVIGAGLSGLTAAYQLLQCDKAYKILILEAKDRIGGRTYTTSVKSASGEDRWDLGGQWVGRPQVHVMKLIKELGIDVYKQYNQGMKLVRLSDGKIREYSTSLPFTSPFSYLDIFVAANKINKLCDELKVEDLFQSVEAKELDSMTMETFVHKHCWTKDTKELFQAACAVIFGAPLCQISALFFIYYCKRAGGLEPLLENDEGSAQEWKIKGGAHGISARLLDHIGQDNLLLGEPVVGINQENEKFVEIITKNGKRILSEYVIMAIPPHQAMKITFSPCLPFKKDQLMHHMPVGNTTKFIVTYDDAFWRKAGLSGEVVSYDNFDIDGDNDCSRNPAFDNDAPVCLVYDATTDNGDAALVGFICGSAAIRWSSKTEEQTKDGITNFLIKCFGKAAADYIDIAIKDWSKEPWNGGCPVNYTPPGTLSVYQHLLSEPFKRLHWAGTETATSWAGFMNGAVQAGQRSANEIQQKLDPSFVMPREATMAIKKASVFFEYFWIVGVLLTLLFAVLITSFFVQ